MIIYALPYAAGNAHAYTDLKKMLGCKLQLISLELPGHGERYKEECLWDIKSMAKDIFLQIKEDLPLEEYCLLGFCMGSYICCELYYLILEKHLPLPAKIYLCAATMKKNRIIRRKDYSKLSNNALLKELKKYHDLSEDILANEDLMKFAMPVIRADFHAIHHYKFDGRADKIQSKGSVLFSAFHNKSHRDIYSWNECFQNQCRFYFINGQQLFIHDAYDEVANILLNDLVLNNELKVI